MNAFDFAADLAKQLLALSASIIAVAATFLEKASRAPIQLKMLKAAVAAHFVSLSFGILHLGTLAGRVHANAAVTGASYGIMDAGPRLTSLFQWLSFAAASLFLVLSIFRDRPSRPLKKPDGNANDEKR